MVPSRIPQPTALELEDARFLVAKELVAAQALAVGPVLLPFQLHRCRQMVEPLVIRPWLPDTSPRPLATERVSSHWVGR